MMNHGSVSVSCCGDNSGVMSQRNSSGIDVRNGNPSHSRMHGLQSGVRVMPCRRIVSVLRLGPLGRLLLMSLGLLSPLLVLPVVTGLVFGELTWGCWHRIAPEVIVVQGLRGLYPLLRIELEKLFEQIDRLWGTTGTGGRTLELKLLRWQR